MKSLLFLLALLTTSVSYGQQAGRVQPDDVINILKHQTSGQKATATKTRIIACVYAFPGNLIDSAVFTYSGLRGSRLFQAGWVMNVGFDPFGIDYIQADTHARYLTPQGQPGTPPTDLRYKEDFSYDASNHMITSSGYGGIPYRHFAHTYSSAGKVIRTDGTNSPTIGGSRSPMLTEVFKYNSANQLVFDSVFDITVGKPNNKHTYAYNATGLKSTHNFYNWDNGTGNWKLCDSISYSYYTNGLLKNYIEVSTYGSPLYFRDSFAYSGSCTFPVFNIEWKGTSANGPWTPYITKVSTLNASGSNYATTLQSEYVSGSYIPFNKMIATFYPDGNPRHADFYEYSAGVQNPNPAYYLTYYYQQYNDPTQVTGLNTNLMLPVYPNPAGDLLTVDLGSFKSNMDIMIQVVDALGRVVKSGATSGGNRYTLNVAQIPTGRYSLRAFDTEGRMSASARFIKQ